MFGFDGFLADFCYPPLQSIVFLEAVLVGLVQAVIVFLRSGQTYPEHVEIFGSLAEGSREIGFGVGGIMETI